MRSIRVRIFSGILICSILTAAIVGVLSVWNIMQMTGDDAKEEMQRICLTEADELNAVISRIEQSVDTLSDLVMQDLDSKAFFADRAYADEYTKQIESVVNGFALHTDGAITAYIRYNPQYSNPTSGVFLTRNSLTDPYDSVTPTDFSMYEEDDMEHVGWYYAPVQNGAPLWMDPYLNANINVYMISYVVPLYSEDGISIGIVGMDIDFSQITDRVDAIQIYDSGYAFLAKADGTILHHKGLEMGASMAEADKSLANVSELLSNGEAEGESYSYSYQGEKKQIVYMSLGNGMEFVLTAPDSEIYAETNRLVIFIVIAVFLAILISAVVGLWMGGSIAKPVTDLTKIISQTAKLDFTSTGTGATLRKRKDETGDMAREIHKMRGIFREMIVNMNHAENTLLSSVENLDMIMKKNSDRSADSSAATQQMAAGMQEAVENTANIAGNIEEVKRNSESIYQLAKDGEQNSEQILVRASAMEQQSGASSDKTNSMYAVMKQKTDAAIEKSKAVQRINELTEDIRDISSQTNLLALNASIEAARAGDAGKGFAVVATEIGALATQTFQTVDDINTIVGEVNEAVSNMTDCIMTMMEFLESTVLGDYVMFQEAGGQYRQDADSFILVMGQIKNEIESLDRYLSQIVVAIGDINETMNQSSEGINVIAEKATENVSASTEGYEKLRESRESVKELHSIVEQFRV